jgi:ribosomal protein L40E
MLARKFQTVELSFSRLRKQFLRGEISREQFADSLRKLRLLDNEGRCWMLGAQTGQWYYYDGQHWIQSEPPEDGRDYLICPDCYHKNDPEARTCQLCGTALVKTSTKIVCINCGNLIDSNQKVCPVCGIEVTSTIDETRGEEGKETSSSVKSSPEGNMAYLGSVDKITFLFFSGGLGIFLGVLFGLILGSTEFFPGVVSSLPSSLKEMQGTLVGAVVFSILGGLFGFILAAASGFLLALLINAAIYFFGGPGFRLEKDRKKISLKQGS